VRYFLVGMFSTVYTQACAVRVVHGVMRRHPPVVDAGASPSSYHFLAVHKMHKCRCPTPTPWRQKGHMSGWRRGGCNMGKSLISLSEGGRVGAPSYSWRVWYFCELHVGRDRVRDQGSSLGGIYVSTVTACWWLSQSPPPPCSLPCMESGA
jgi:hypothetical protein